MPEAMHRAVGRPKDYRTFMRSADHTAVVPVVKEHFLAWVEGKNAVLDEGSRTELSTEGRGLASLFTWNEGDLTLLRGRLIEEDHKTGQWSSEVLASTEGWLHLSVTNSAGHYAAVPNLAKELMRNLDLRDADLELRDDVRMWDVAQLDQLVELLLSPDRNGLVLVAGTGPEPRLFDAYNERLPRWIRDAYGLAQVITLTPQATYGLERRLELHAPMPWTIRTYYPGLRLGSEADSRRHRYLTVETLAKQSDGRIRHLLGTVARGHAASRALPPEVVGAVRTLDRAEAQRTLDRLTSATLEAKSPRDLLEHPTEGREAPEPLGVSAVVAVPESLESIRTMLGVAELTESAVASALSAIRSDVIGSVREELAATEAMVYEQMARIEELEDEHRDCRSGAEDDELDRADLLDEIDGLRARVKWLQVRLTEAQDFDSPFGAVPDEFRSAYPESCEALLLALEDRGGVVFTGDLNNVREVDEADSFGACLREATACVASLREYVRAKRDGAAVGGVHHFLCHRPAGYDGVSPGKHAHGETAYTRTHHGKERLFPVPASVDESGSAPMMAHFKLARLGMVSPRLHYLDDTAGTGLVYIGYLGRHLTNRHTN